jgi:DNA helicase-2/ATP-dependent DNA helicase PcrA
VPDFFTEYQKLNPEQKLAVDSLDGPIMVIAGAGTGKTQTIALRIANILQKTDTPPSSILCLTYTDVAAINMRSRLLSLIGPDCYKVKICTFHSFCNEIIESYPDLFLFNQNQSAIDDLSRIEIIRKIIDSLPNDSSLVSWGDRYFYQKSIIDSISLVKRENISSDTLLSLISDQQFFTNNSKKLFETLSTIRATKNNYPILQKIIDDILSLPNLSLNLKSHLQVISSSSENLSYVKTSLRQFYEDIVKNIDKQKEFVNIFNLYLQELTKLSLYDYEDMILFVLKAFTKNPSLLIDYQEKYHYILVDEYQDTNSAQNEILNLLGSYDSHPNLFVVGDDDQSIYRFQGASVENIFTFYQQYHPQIIVLKNNYRSQRLILDSSTSIINRNQNRISKLIPSLDKSLIATKDYDPDPVNLTISASSLEENYFIAQKIKSLLDVGEQPNNIAVLYRKNSDVDELLPFLSAFNIKYFLTKEADILKSPFIIQFIKLLEYINKPTDYLLFHLIAAPFLKFNPLDLTSSPTPAFKKKIEKLNKRIAKTQADLLNHPLPSVFQKILKRFKVTRYLLKNNDYICLNQIHTLFEFLKKNSQKQNLSLADFINKLSLYTQNQIAIPSPPLDYDSTDAIRLSTVHGAKGLEFNHVFIFKLLADSWEKQRDLGKLKLPKGVLKSEVSKIIEDDFEEDRRLFYVALTRAQKQIYLSYSQYKESGKVQDPSVFISEIDLKFIEVKNISLKAQALKTFYTAPTAIDPSLKDYLNSYLSTKYCLTPTHLNSYLRCPLCFYYTTILKIPQSKNKFSSFGTAIHSALSFLYLKQPPLPEIINKFSEALNSESLGQVDYDWCLSRGTQVLSDYYHQYSKDFAGDYSSEYNFAKDHLHLENIPITGKIDLITKSKNGQVVVTDFKTGSPDNKNDDYFRQLVFYKLLLDLKGDPTLRFSQGVIDYVEKSKLKNAFVRKEYEISDDDKNNLISQIKDVYQKILALDFFHIGADCRDPNHLHYLLKNQIK